VDSLGVVADEVEVILHQRVAQLLGLVLLVIDPDLLDVLDWRDRLGRNALPRRISSLRALLLLLRIYS
jgi:hypothetical protein